MQATIQNLINAHRNDRKRIEVERTQPAIKVSRAVSFLAVLYERIRNTVDLEEEHLLRKRAIKRIMLRMAALKDGDPNDLSSNITREIIWAQYLSDYPVPNIKLEIVANVIKKYQALTHYYKTINKKKMENSRADLLYGIAAFEIDRIFVPYNQKDSLVNAMFYFVKDKGIINSTDLPKEYQSIQTYISTHRALLKSDDENIAFHLFYNRFPAWVSPKEEDMRIIAANFDKVVSDIQKHLEYKSSNKVMKEVVRQSIPFKIIDKIVKQNLPKAEELFSSEESVSEKVYLVCEEEYKENKRRLTNTIVRSIIYLFITKVLLALIIEVPYEMALHGHINFVTLGINIFFPITSMFIIANSFSIPSDKNTEVIQQMIRAILSVDQDDDKKAFAQIKTQSSSLILLFRGIYFATFLLIFGAILVILYLLNFNLPGMFIFVVFFSTIFFFASRIRNTATELKVLNTSPSIFSPILDMFATPILILGKKLSEGASQLNVFVVIFDFLIEAPFKTIIKVFEEWNNFIRETREEIV